MNSDTTRYEFRLFAPHMGTTEQRLRSLASCEAITESREIYLLDCESALENNIKIREGRLELKRLIERKQGLERWEPAGRWDFPVSTDTIRTLWPDTVLEHTALPASDVSLPQLLRVIRESGSNLHRVNIFKRRFRFTLMGCDAELDHLQINGAALESFAVESVDPRAVLEVQSELRLEKLENQSYPLMMCRLIGMRPLPDERDYG